MRWVGEVLSAVRKPFDFYTFNPWLKRLPEYVASDDAPLVEKLAKLPDLALFCVSALFGLYFALWRRYRDLALGAARALHRGGLAGAAATASRPSPSPSCLVSAAVSSGAGH